MGIDRQQIVDNYYPPGSEVADHFTPCAIPFACEGDQTCDFNLDEAKQLLAEGMAEEGIDKIDTKLSFRTRSAATSRIRPRSRPRSQAS